MLLVIRPESACSRKASQRIWRAGLRLRPARSGPRCAHRSGLRVQALTRIRAHSVALSSARCVAGSGPAGVRPVFQSSVPSSDAGLSQTTWPGAQLQGKLPWVQGSPRRPRLGLGRPWPGWRTRTLLRIRLALESSKQQLGLVGVGSRGGEFSCPSPRAPKVCPSIPQKSCLSPTLSLLLTAPVWGQMWAVPGRGLGVCMLRAGG